jgi:threonine dehydratase
MNPFSLTDILKAQKLIDCYLCQTPLYHSPSLSEMIGTEIHVKYENHSPIGSYKARGVLNLLLSLAPDVRGKGVVTCTTGNQGYAVAWVGQMLGIPTTVFVAENANTDKVAAIRRFGSEVVVTGRDYDEARPRSVSFADESGMHFVEDGEDLTLLAGHATIALEILQSQPDVDALVVPVGSASLLVAVAGAARLIKPDLTIIGAVPEGAPCMYLSWKARQLISTPTSHTFADGLSARVPNSFLLTSTLELADELVLVPEEDIKKAVETMLAATHNLCEGAGAIPLAACLRYPHLVRGKKVALLVTGGNLPVAKLLLALGRNAT